VIGDMQPIALTSHVRANGFTGVHRCQSRLKNRLQIMSQLLPVLHGLSSFL
jgi:hypothetical protein